MICLIIYRSHNADDHSSESDCQYVEVCTEEALPEILKQFGCYKYKGQIIGLDSSSSYSLLLSPGEFMVVKGEFYKP